MITPISTSAATASDAASSGHSTWPPDAAWADRCSLSGRRSRSTLDDGIAGTVVLRCAHGGLLLGHPGAVTLTIDDDRRVQTLMCDQCGAYYEKVTGFVYEDGDALAVYYAACHNHGGQHEAWIDVIFGDWGTDDSSKNVTFGCRVGPVANSDEPAATLVPAAAVYGDSPIFGHKLTREEALTHQLLADNWRVVDYILVTDATVSAHVYGQPA